MFESTLSTLPHIMACDLRALAVTLPSGKNGLRISVGIPMPIVTCRVC
jgi:hypothetical protein